MPTIQTYSTGFIKEITVTPTITSGSAYATGNQLGSLITLSNVCRDVGLGAVLQSISCSDFEKKDVDIDCFIFNQSVTVTSTDRTAANITKANLSGGKAKVVTVTGYKDLSAVSVASVAGISLPIIPPLSTASRDLYVLLVIRGAATFTTTSSLELTFTFLQD